MTREEKIKGLYSLKEHLIDYPIELEGHKALPITLIDYAIEALEQEPKTGHWIRVDKDKCKCDQCEVISFIGLYPNGDINYCPNCGAKMIEPQESEGEND